jgi:hypothetical protein
MGVGQQIRPLKIRVEFELDENLIKSLQEYLKSKRNKLPNQAAIQKKQNK